MAWMFVFWLTVLPLITLWSTYEGPKVYWVWTGGFILTIWCIVRLLRNHKILNPPHATLFLGWIAILLIASVLGIHPLASFIGGSYRHQGVLFFLTLFLIATAIPILQQNILRILPTILIGVAGIESLLVIYQKIIIPAARPLGTLGEPNAVAGYLAISMYWLFTAKIPKRIRIAGYILMLAAIIATGSRTGIGTVAIVSGAYLFHLLRKQKQLFNRTVVTALVVISISIVSGMSIAAVSQNRPASLYESRPLFWKLGLEQLLKRPVLGYGAESGELVYDRAFKSIHTNLDNLMVDRSHSLLLDVAIWSGLIGLAVFCIWLYRVGHGMYISGSYVRLGAFCAWLLFACFQPLGVVHWVQLILIVFI